MWIRFLVHMQKEEGKVNIKGILHNMGSIKFLVKAYDCAKVLSFFI